MKQAHKRARQLRNINRRLWYLLTMILVIGMERGVYTRPSGIAMIVIGTVFAVAVDLVVRKFPRTVGGMLEEMIGNGQAELQRNHVERRRG